MAKKRKASNQAFFQGVILGAVAVYVVQSILQRNGGTLHLETTTRPPVVLEPATQLPASSASVSGKPAFRRLRTSAQMAIQS